MKTIYLTNMPFQLGNLVSTREVHELIANDKIDVQSVLSRYVSCDWGNTSAKTYHSEVSDVYLNDMAVANGNDRIVAKYNLDYCELLIITEADRSSTTMMLTNEY